LRKLVSVSLAAVVLLAACKRGEKAAPATTSGTYANATTTEAQPANSGAPTSASGALDVGSAMPEYSATALDGSKFELASHRDKVVLLNIWATWCGPCRFEIPELQTLQAKYAARGFEVVGISVDESGVDSVRQFVDQNKMTYPIAIDAEGRIAGMFQTSVLPTSAIVDRTGRVIWKKYGAIEPNDAALRKAIEKAL
jgi:thiol-disulfide isomerase/thioredoxin